MRLWASQALANWRRVQQQAQKASRWRHSVDAGLDSESPDPASVVFGPRGPEASACRPRRSCASVSGPRGSCASEGRGVRRQEGRAKGTPPCLSSARTLAVQGEIREHAWTEGLVNIPGHLARAWHGVVHNAARGHSSCATSAPRISAGAMHGSDELHRFAPPDAASGCRCSENLCGSDGRF